MSNDDAAFANKKGNRAKERRERKKRFIPDPVFYALAYIYLSPVFILFVRRKVLPNRKAFVTRIFLHKVWFLHLRSVLTIGFY